MQKISRTGMIPKSAPNWARELNFFFVLQEIVDFVVPFHTKKLYLL